MGLDFNPGPSAPRADDTHDAEPNIIGPFYNLDGLITHISVQGAKEDDSDEEAYRDSLKELKGEFREYAPLMNRVVRATPTGQPKRTHALSIFYPFGSARRTCASAF